MKSRSLMFLVVFFAAVLFSVSAQAALVDMHDGTIYDTDTQLSWLQNANTVGVMTWANAVAWAASLNNGSGYAGLTGWRLPNADPACDSNFNCTNSEMGHLYYTELGNVAENPLAHTGSFTGMQARLYWSGTDYAPDPTGAWYFYLDGGFQTSVGKGYDGYAWAVRPGARSTSASTPVPATGTVGLIVSWDWPG